MSGSSYSWSLALILPLMLSACSSPVTENENQPVQMSGRAPEPLEAKGGLGYVARLADGRLFAVHGECRPREKWDDASIAQPVYGRFSEDSGETWSGNRHLFDSTGPGWIHTVLPLATREGDIHLFGLIIHHLTSPVDWTKASADIWHSVSKDGGQSWTSQQKIEWKRRYTGQINSGIELQSGRLLVAYSYMDEARATGYFVSETIYSDDKGQTWHSSSNNVPVASGGKRLESGAAEPVIVQLEDSRVWMVIRTQTGYLFESHSSDDGASWSPPQRTVLRASNAPAAVLRANGKLFLAWNHEIGEPFHGSVSYSRQSLVMATKEGDRWRGYRQINPSFAPEDTKGVARYPFLVPLDDGRILLGYREDGRLSRETETSVAPCTTYWNGGTRLFAIDPGWLLESGSSLDLSQGIQDLQTAGTAGVEVVSKSQSKQALHLTKPKPDQPSGATWNFPHAAKGSLKIRLRVEPGFQGARFTLSEYFVSPSNHQGGSFRWMIDPDFNLRIQYVSEGPFQKEDGKTLQGDDLGARLSPGKDHEISLDWNSELNLADLSLDGQYAGTLLGVEPAQGMAYIRLAAGASGTDSKGFWVTSLESRAAD